MDYPPFYRTRCGEIFFGKQLPELIRAIERLAAALERVVVVREQGQREKSDADA